VTSLIVAKRYARALLDLGKEDGNLEKYGEELTQVVGLFDQSNELETVLANPAIVFDNRQKVLDSLLEKLGLSPISKNFFRLLMDRGRVDAVRAIATIYQGLLDEAKGITRAEVVSAASLDEAAVGRLAQALKDMAGREVELQVKEDPSLIGGVVARIGDLVLDGSVRSQLENLKDSLKRGEYA
jgi:F-type H+-transporting ATPase subunit delta